MIECGVDEDTFESLVERLMDICGVRDDERDHVREGWLRVNSRSMARRVLKSRISSLIRAEEEEKFLN